MAMISRETVTNAVSALVKHLHSQSSQKKAQLLDTDDLLHLLITLKRIPSTSKTNPFRIPLPHPLHSLPSSTSICLFLSDHTSLTDVQSSLPNAYVIPLSALRTDYRPYEARRKLCDSHHLFFADRSILPHLPRLLGKTFFKKKKIPLAIDFSRADFVKQIEKACSSSLLYLRTGTSSGLKVGRVSQSVEEIVDNVVAAIEGAVMHIPRKWGNVRSLYVKSVESLALPIYQAVPDIGLKIQSGEEKPLSKKRGRVVTDEETDEVAAVVEGFVADGGKAVGKRSKVGAEKKVVESSKKKRGRVMDTVTGDDEGVVEKVGEDDGGEENSGVTKKVKESKAGVEKRVEEKLVVSKEDIVEDDGTEEKTVMDKKSKKSKVGAEKRVKKTSILTKVDIIEDDVKEEETETGKKSKKTKLGVEKRVKKSFVLTNEDIVEDDVKEEKTGIDKKSKKRKVGVEKKVEKDEIPVKTGKISKKEKSAEKSVKNAKRSTARKCC